MRPKSVIPSPAFWQRRLPTRRNLTPSSGYLLRDLSVISLARNPPTTTGLDRLLPEAKPRDTPKLFRRSGAKRVSEADKTALYKRKSLKTFRL